MPTCALVLLVLTAITAGESAPDPLPQKPAGTVIVTLQGALPLRPSMGLFLSGGESGLHEATMAVQRALKAPEPRVVLDLSNGFAPGLAAAEELAAVLRTRPAGKTVACLIDAVTDAVLVVAAACDEVATVEAGMLAIAGVDLSTDYYADALAKLGVRFHAVTSGPAKTAPEPLTRSGPTPAAVAEHRGLAAALDRVLVRLSARGALDDARLAAARAQAPQPGALAVTLGLADRAVEPGGWLRDQPAPVRRLDLDDRAKPDLGSLAGLMRLWGELLNGDQTEKASRAVAVLELAGLIVDDDASTPGSTIAAGDTVRLIDRLAGDPRLVAVVLRIDSGGGSATASDRIYQALRRLAVAKPVVALIDGVAASGGYYLACGAREVQVHRGSITGSIGVFAIVPDLSATRALLGIHRHTVTTAPRADLFSTGAMTADKEAALRQVIADVDARFQGVVAGARHLARDKVAELAGGRVFTGEQAVELGLADRFGTLALAVARARELAGVAEALPLERHPARGGLGSLGNLLGLPGLAGSQATALLTAAASWQRRGLPAVLAWAPLSAP